YEGRYGQGSMPCDYAGTYTFEVTGEIIVDNKNVKVVTSSCNQDLLIWDDDPRIYFYENDSFYLMMDFSVTVGDTLYHSAPSNSECFSLDCYCEIFNDPDHQILSIITKD